jgi:dTDP-4-amino-4,6-dideoxygalactose transaminase
MGTDDRGGSGRCFSLHRSRLRLARLVRQRLYRVRSFPVAERFAERWLSLPMFADLIDEQIDYVSERIVEAVSKTERRRSRSITS